MEMNWSRWSRCESSFELLLVPSQPGVFALAEEIVQPAGPESRRMLAVFEVNEAEDLSRSLSRLFAVGSPWRERMAKTRCYIRYALAPSTADRRAATAALRNWLSTQREVASQIFERAHPVVVEHETDADMEDTELKTMAERAVDRVIHGMKIAKTAGR